MDLEQLLIALVVIIGYSLVSRRLSSLWISMPMVLVGAGWLLAALDLVDAQLERELILVIAEFTLVVILFGDAVRIDPARLRRQSGLPARLLLIGLPLSIVFGGALGVLVLDEVSVAAAALLAAILAPTDAALGAAVVEDPAVPARERLALNVESGVNDGLVVPIVAVLTAIVLDEERSSGQWVEFAIEQIGLGIAVGLVLGWVAIQLLSRAHLAGWSDGRYEQLVTFLVPIGALVAADVVGGNSFIAAFVGGVTFGACGVTTAESHPAGSAEHFAEFTEDAAQLFAMVAFFLFGNVFVHEVLPDVDGRAVVLAIASLTVVRMVPVWLALVGSGTPWQTRLFLGWFGPRGLASIVFGLLLLEDVETLAPIGEELFSVIALTVVGSVLLHGISATPGAQRYGAWAERADAMEHDADMAEHEMPSTRWS